MVVRRKSLQKDKTANRTIFLLLYFKTICSFFKCRVGTIKFYIKIKTITSSKGHPVEISNGLLCTSNRLSILSLMSWSGVGLGLSNWILRVATVVSSPSTSPTVVIGPSDMWSKGSGFQLLSTTNPNNNIHF